MPTYVILIKWTDAGAAAVKNTMNRIQSARRTAEESGGRIISQYWTQGPYDEVRVVEFPDDESLTAAILSMGLRGFVRTETMRAFTEEEMARIVEKLPDTVQGGAQPSPQRT